MKLLEFNTKAKGFRPKSVKYYMQDDIAKIYLISKSLGVPFKSPVDNHTYVINKDAKGYYYERVS